AGMLRLGDSTLDLLARGSLAALLFGLLLVPSAPIHNQIDAATGASFAVQPDLSLSVALLDEHAGHLGGTANPGLLQLETDQSLTGQVLHGAHDGLIGQVAALPLGFLGLLLLSPGGLKRFRRRRRPEPDGRPRHQWGRRVTLMGAAALVPFAVIGGGVPGGLPAVSKAQAASDPCTSSSTPTKTFNVSAINVKITLNHF